MIGGIRCISTNPFDFSPHKKRCGLRVVNIAVIGRIVTQVCRDELETFLLKQVYWLVYVCVIIYINPLLCACRGPGIDLKAR